MIILTKKKNPKNKKKKKQNPTNPTLLAITIALHGIQLILLCLPQQGTGLPNVQGP
jgi:hypothetical protein